MLYDSMETPGEASFGVLDPYRIKWNDKDVAMATECLNREVDRDPNNSLALYYLSRLQWMIGEKQQALEKMVKSVALEPNSESAIIQLYHMAGRLLMIQIATGQWQKTRRTSKIFQSVVARIPERSAKEWRQIMRYLPIGKYPME